MLADRVILVCVIVFAGLYFWATAQIPSLEIGDPLGPKAFPDLLGIGLLLTAGLLFLEMRRNRAASAERDERSPEQAREERGHFLVIAAVTIWTALYYAVFEHLGYMLSTMIFLLVLTAYFHRGRWITNILTAVLFSVLSYAFFVHGLGVTLAPGVLSF